jgi:uncharacterized protein (TIGR02145 family)
MKKILLGFIAIGLLTFLGCDKEKQKGCTEPNAINYDLVAEENDGSCKYAETTETKITDGIITSSDDGTTETSSDGGTTETSSDGGTTETSSNELIDLDFNTYKSLIIGEQEWMAENLRTTKYSDGTSIPNVIGKTDWSSLSTGAWSHYNNDNQYDTIYGKLYNGYAVETGKLCPTGWHVPTDAEWTTLEDYLTADGQMWKEGKTLKSTSGWNDFNNVSGGNGTDAYGWNGLPSGNRHFRGDFDFIGYYGAWWSSSAIDADDSWNRYLGYDGSLIYRSSPKKFSGFSVRCLRD